MTPELKAKWVEALRSGEYKQGFGRLRQQGEGAAVAYCCIGVLCEVAGFKPHGDRYLDERLIPLIFSLDASTSRLLGLPSRVESSLITSNDNGSTFAEIADKIERSVPVDES